MIDAAKLLKNNKALNLIYVDCKDPGYKRKALKSGFVYLNCQNQIIKDSRTLDRIKALVIPPNWSEVWICPHENGHIQATGMDQKSRKQYLYHSSWSSFRSSSKFHLLSNFGKTLPLFRKKLKRDIQRKNLDLTKVCAIALWVMDETSIRSGNSFYCKQNGSYGLTTLINKQVKIETDKIFFKYVGKKGVLQQKYLKEKRLAKLLKSIKDLPGQQLFQYYDENKKIRPLEALDLNNYLQEIFDSEITCKTFRTWNACFYFLDFVVNHEIPSPDKERKELLISAIDYVAKQLGNSRAVTRKHYIDPKLIQSYENKELDKWISSTSSKTAVEQEKSIHRKLLQLL